MFKFIKRSLAIKTTVMIFIMVLVSALTVGGVVLFSGQKQYDEQNFGLLDIQTRRIQEEIIRYFNAIDQLSILFHKIPIEELTVNYTKAIARYNSDLRVIQIFSKSGTLLSTQTFGVKEDKVDNLTPKVLERPIVLGSGRYILSPTALTSQGVPIESGTSIMRLRVDHGNKFLIIGIDVKDHFNRFAGLQGDGAELIVFDTNGALIYHPNPIKQLSFTHNIPYSVRDEFPNIKYEEFFGQGNSITNKKITVHRKEDVYLYYRRVFFKNLHIGGIVYTIPTINLPGFIRSFDSKQLFLILLVISILPLFAWPMLKYLFRDLKEITYKAQQYTNGEHDLLIDVHSQDEIGVLALTFQGMIRQVNERTRYLRKSERRIREARDQAEQALSSKSHLLEDLREQKAEIERVSKDKDDLLAIVSHDLKNPLAVIETSMDVIMEEKDSLSEVTADLIRRSKNSARIALNLITDLLDLARLEGGIKLDFEKFSVADLIENVVDSYYLKSSEKNITVSIHSDTNYDLIADYGRVVQVLSNILGNALKFTPENGKIDITVNSYETTQAYDGTLQGLELRIEDTGPGIPKNKLETIFNKFEQARSNDRKIGTGLGLTIVKNICELHNGSVTVTSEEGHGSTFVIRLPRLMSQEQQEGATLKEDSKVIFIANDDELYRKRIKKIFRDSSYKVAEATNGEEVLRYLDKQTPDLIILDHLMPVKNGIKALMEYFDSDNRSMIPVILLSNSVEQEDNDWIREHIYDILPENAAPSEIENRAISILHPNQLTSLDKRLDPYKKTVLIVDDEDAIRALLNESVTSAGYNCITAKNGVEALFLIQKYRTDIVISDIRMSEGDGILLTKAIKKEYPDLPVALMSAAIDGISENVAMKLGVEYLITKPFDINSFSDHIYKIIADPKLSVSKDIFRDGHNSELHPRHVAIPLLGDMDEPDLMKDHNLSPSLEDSKKTNQSSRVLLVDDSNDMQMLFKLLLRKENVDLVIVDNGEDALSKVKELKESEYFDTIFMDLNMPNMNGDEATSLIRTWEKEQGRTKHRIVLLSASSIEEAQALLKKGFDSFIQKPINKDKILGEINAKKAS